MLDERGWLMEILRCDERDISAVWPNLPYHGIPAYHQGVGLK
jgi:hypothetical protein